jgi:UMF1 family MFS transporter
LGIVLALILSIEGGFVIRIAFLITAAFYGLATLPVFIFVSERTQPQKPSAGENHLSESVRKLWRTFQEARQYKEFIKYLGAYLIYNNGIMMILDFAAIIGAVLFGMSQQQLIIFMMVVQVTSVIGAFAFGWFTQRAGARLSLLIALGLMMLAVILLMFVNSLSMFNVIGALAGFALTGVQSVSRTVVGQVTPPGKAGEFYGLFSVAGQISNFTGPALYGFLATALALRLYEPRGYTAHAAEAAGLETALLAVIAFFLVGMVMLFSVKKWRR